MPVVEWRGWAIIPAPMVVVVGGRKGLSQEVLGSHVTASDLERLMTPGHYDRGVECSRCDRRGVE